MIHYLTPTPPQLSETFIVDEIAVLRAMGITVRQIALNPAASEAVLPVTAPVRFARLRTWSQLVVRRWYRFPAWLTAVVRFRGTARWVVLRSLDVAAIWMRDEPEHVHVHFVDQTSVAAMLASRLWRVPVTATAHARDIFDPPEIRFPTFARYGLGVVAVCRYNRRELIKRGVPESSIAVIPCGVRTASHLGEPRSPASYGGRLRILVVARLVAKKGIDDLLAAVGAPEVARLVEEVRVIGGGPARDRLEALAEIPRAAGVRIRFLGALDRTQHGVHQSWANLFCLPCKVAADGDRDSMPVAIKEALVAQLPVLTSLAVGIPEMLDTRTAVLVEPGSREDIGRGLLSFAARAPDERARLAIAGHDRVVSRFDIVDTVSALASLLREGAMPTTWSHVETT